MVKQKKEDTGELMISIEQFSRTRDSVIVSLSNLQKGLSHVQNGLQDMMNAYIKHTTSVIAGEDGALEALSVLPLNIAETAKDAMAAATSAVNNVNQSVAAATPAAEPEPGKTKKRKREKKEKDPNAPKRPLTAAFLYAQHARPIVKRDLESSLAPGAKLEPNAVNFEVNKRWNEMLEEDKEKWRASYRSSMEQFKEDLAAYKVSKGSGADLPHEDEEVSDEAEAGVLEAGALDSEAEFDSEDEAAPEPSPVAKAHSPPAANGKTPRATKRQKTAQAPQVNGTTIPIPIAPAGSGPTPVPLPISSRQAAQAVPPTSNVEPAVNTTSAKEKKDKKKKSANVPIAPAPAPGKEPSPDDGKKKTKSGRTTRNADVDAETAAAQSQEKENKVPKKRDRSKRKSEAAAA